MKVICCDVCQSFIPLSSVWQQCRCGNISGVYLSDGLHAQVVIEDKTRGRVIGVPNSIRYGFKREDTCWVFKETSDRIDFLKEHPK